MKRFLAVIMVCGLAAALAGCGGGGAKSQGDGASRAPGSGGAGSASAELAKPDPYAEIPASEGAHEKAAYGLVPKALAASVEPAKSAGKTMPDMTGLTPVMYAYQIRVESGGQVTLFEVRKDGKVSALYAWPAAPDPAKLIWTPADWASAPDAVEPAGERETAAVAGVRAFMDKAKPGADSKVSVEGYYFAMVGKDGKPAKRENDQDILLGMTPAGNVIMYPF
jgi:hypothetical protein